MSRSVIVAACLAFALPAYAQTSTQPDHGAQATTSPTTRQFVEKVATSDMFEVESSRLAVEKSSADAVKQFARKMVADHTKTSNELKPMVQKMQGVQLPTELDAPHRQKLDQLRSASGVHFDRQYRTEQIEAHQTAVKLFDDFAKNGDNGDLKSWAQRTLPDLQHHLQQAQALPQQGQGVTQAPTTSDQGRQADTRAGSTQQGTTRAIANPSPNHIMASDLRGTKVYGADNQSIGNIDDIVLDRNGRIAAVVVGVGGFLGIGEKNVAVPFDAIQITQQGQDTTGATRAPTTGTAGERSGQGAGQQSGTIQPDRIVLRGMTKQDLENAPSFRSNQRGQDRR
jgi:putative membrane protein